MAKTVTETMANKVLKSLAAWLGEVTGNGAPVPTGEDAFRQGAGPLLMMDRDGDGRPIIVMEGVLYDWTIRYTSALWEGKATKVKGMYLEPISGCELGLYRDDV